ncbi:magnesium transporter CorA family protein [Fictibacillus iocasae]|uniref:Magnesium transporter CorA family protein n=1 Tax=Fictibacillus iocasae TaxID=2715437 RepID=A0ABW2NQL7_9BACL
MKHTMPYNWTYYDLNGERDLDRLRELTADNEGCSKWADHAARQKTNFLQIDQEENGQYVLRGSLIYTQNPKDQDEYKVAHFYLTEDKFITVNLELDTFTRTSKEHLLSLMEKVETAPEGFFIFLGEVLNHFLDGIDELETKLKQLQNDVQKNNHTNLLNMIYDRRIELINWSDLAIAVEDTRLAAKEAFLDKLTETDAYKRTQTRIDRTLTLVRNYRMDIDTLLNLEEVLSSHRGNEIMKTLTVFTVIFTPMMGFGAIWGMNFENMPELKWKLGYLYAMLLIGGSTIGVYIWLRMKGWTGDLLKGRKKTKHFD